MYSSLNKTAKPKSPLALMAILVCQYSVGRGSNHIAAFIFFLFSGLVTLLWLVLGLVFYLWQFFSLFNKISISKLTLSALTKPWSYTIDDGDHEFMIIASGIKRQKCELRQHLKCKNKMRKHFAVYSETPLVTNWFKVATCPVFNWTVWFMVCWWFVQLKSEGWTRQAFVWYFLCM